MSLLPFEPAWRLAQQPEDQRWLVEDLEMLLQTKRAAGRPKDLEALAELEHCGSLRIRSDRATSMVRLAPTQTRRPRVASTSEEPPGP